MNNIPKTINVNIFYRRYKASKKKSPSPPSQINYRLIATGVLLGISEILPFIKGEESNGIAEKCIKILKTQ